MHKDWSELRYTGDAIVPYWQGRGQSVAGVQFKWSLASMLQHFKYVLVHSGANSLRCKTALCLDPSRIFFIVNVMSWTCVLALFVWDFTLAVKWKHGSEAKLDPQKSYISTYENVWCTHSEAYSLGFQGQSHLVFGSKSCLKGVF